MHDRVVVCRPDEVEYGQVIGMVAVAIKPAVPEKLVVHDHYREADDKPHKAGQFGKRMADECVGPIHLDRAHHPVVVALVARDPNG